MRAFISFPTKRADFEKNDRRKTDIAVRGIIAQPPARIQYIGWGNFVFVFGLQPKKLKKLP